MGRGGSFKIEELEQAHALNTREIPAKTGEGRKTMVGRRDKRPMVESEVLIKKFILEAIEPVTMLEICDHIGRSPSPQYRAIVNELVKTGQVARGEEPALAGNLPKYWYWRP